MKDRIEINGDYLIYGVSSETGRHRMYTERAFLVDNLINFMNQHEEVEPHNITIYELVEINEEQIERKK